jgi:membrane-associated protease RseP (regulator of RpoE activity)
MNSVRKPVYLFTVLVGAFLVFTPLLQAQEPPQEQGRVEKHRDRVYFFGGPPGRGYVGVQLLNLTPELRSHFGVSEDTGVMVAKVEPGSPAEQAGVQVGDIVTEIDGNPVDSSWSLSRYVRGKKEGDSVSLEVWREGGAQAVFVTIVEKEREAVFLGGPGMGVPVPPPGVRVFEKGGPLVGDGPEFNIQLGDEDLTTAWENALGNLEERFNSEDWQERLERIQSMDWEGMRKRMEELETRLKALESELSAEESKQ